MRRARCLVLMATVLLTAAACSDDKIEGAGGGGGGDAFLGDGAGGSFTWTSHVRAILDRCTRCHSTENSGDARNGAPASVNFNTYEEAVQSADRALEMISRGFMPPAGNSVGAEPLSAAERSVVEAWINAGMPE